MISDTQVIIALLFSLVSAYFAFLLGQQLYKG
nr:photosystem I reaction center subunit M [Meringosphaera mediterranea]